MLSKLLMKNRSYRRFQQEPAPDLATLKGLVELARLAPSASNQQPLKYVLVHEPQKRAQVFSCLTWAGYLTGWSGPKEDERPTAYIIILSDPKLSTKPAVDVGLVAQTMLLGAQELGFGGCLLRSVDRPRLQEYLNLPTDLEVQLVMALGTPGEEVKLTTVGSDGDIRYWRDEQDIHYVPKRLAQDQILAEF